MERVSRGRRIIRRDDWEDWISECLLIVIIFHSITATQHWFYYKYWSPESEGWKEGIVCLSRSMDPFISFQTKHSRWVNQNVVSSIGVTTQNISISAAPWISRLRQSEVLEWLVSCLEPGRKEPPLTPHPSPSSLILTEEADQVLFCLSVLARLDVSINILLYNLIQGRCGVTPTELRQPGVLQVKMFKYPNDLYSCVYAV